ncbi:MAG TPA: hypothetical protein P5536_01735 [Methanoregulaceae archaeon]|nr:hypothetical protein [Methanoregulaceae archaeon]HRT14783.1 hypothetical protein [Methanoregulaceae archaeon]HRU30356.1 hypothetical protein [Methanoregulaceae archaeon]
MQSGTPDGSRTTLALRIALKLLSPLVLARTSPDHQPRSLSDLHTSRMSPEAFASL